MPAWRAFLNLMSRVEKGRQTRGHRRQRLVQQKYRWQWLRVNGVGSRFGGKEEANVSWASFGITRLLVDGFVLDVLGAGAGAGASASKGSNAAEDGI